jgi:lysyl-tRNA synthetase class 2
MAGRNFVRRTSVHRGMTAMTDARPAIGRSRIPATRVVAALAGLVGILNLISVFVPRLARRLEFIGDVLPGVDVVGPGVSVALGVLLLGLAQGLARGKRRAWRLAVGLLVVEVLLQSAQHHPVVALASLALLTLLVVTRHQFVGQADPSSRRHTAVVGAGLLVAAGALGFLSLTLLDRAVHAGVSAPGRLWATAQGLVGIPSELTAPDGREQDVVYYLLLSLGVLTVAVTGYLAFRSATPVHQRSADEARELRRLLEGWGSQDSLAYFASRDDRALVWAPQQRAAVSYRVVAGAALAAGDPLGARAHWPEAIEEFLRLARERAWVPAVVAASQSGASAWQEHGGLTALEFGDEAVLRPETFTLHGRDRRNVRQAVARAERAGYEVRVERLADLEPERVMLLRDRSDRWRADDVERGFSMGLGRVDADRDPRSMVVSAWWQDRPVAMLVLVPWGDDGLSLDLMRRSPDAESGVNELLVSTLLARCEDFGIRRVSLNFAVFRDAIERAERLGAGPGTRAWGRLLKAVSRWSQADSLYRFNAKFHPEWQPRYLVYASATGLPRVAVAYLEAESLVRRPRLPRRGADR